MQKKLDLPTQEELYQFFNGNPDRTVFVGQIYDIENVNFEDVHILPKLLTKGIKVIVELTQMSAKGNFDYQKLFTTISHKYLYSMHNINAICLSAVIDFKIEDTPMKLYINDDGGYELFSNEEEIICGILDSIDLLDIIKKM